MNITDMLDAIVVAVYDGCPDSARPTESWLNTVCRHHATVPNSRRHAYDINWMYNHLRRHNVIT